MKKILSLILVLCMLVASVPVFAEASESESGLLGLLSGLLEDEGESQGSSLYYLMEFIAGLKMRIAGNKTMIRAIVSFLVNKLADKFGGKLGSLAGLLESVVLLQEFMEEMDYGGMETVLQDGPPVEEESL